MKRFLDVYWVIYFLGYLIAIAILLWLFWGRLLDGDGLAQIFLLAAVFGTAAGASSAFAIIVEGGGRIVLLIPATVKKLKDEGRKEGHIEGHKEGKAEGLAEGKAEGKVEGLVEGLEVGRKEERRDVGERYWEARRRFGVETDEGVMLPDTPEVRRFLYGEEQD